MFERNWSGIGNDHRNDRPRKHGYGDITAAAAAIFASANANSWPTGEAHAYRMGSICWWRKGDKGGNFFGYAGSSGRMSIKKENYPSTDLYGAVLLLPKDEINDSWHGGR